MKCCIMALFLVSTVQTFSYRIATLIASQTHMRGNTVKSLIPWFCIVATASANVAFADEGLDAYREGRYIKASEQLATDSSKDPIINYYMGRMRLYGYGQLKNNVAAMRDFQHAAEKGFLPAQHIMALYSLLQLKNPEQALYWFKKAADANDTRAQMYSAAAYLFGVGVKKNEELAKRYYIAAARSGDSIAQCALAENFLDSHQAANKKLGLIWLNKSVAQNNPEAQLRLGQMYASGTLVGVDLVKAKELIGLSVAQGYLPAVYQMGELAQKQNDWEQAKEWYTKAAMVHYGPAEMGLAQLYLQEKCPFHNTHLGFLWMLKAAQNGLADAQLALATMYKNGQGVDIDENLAKEWQLKAVASTKDTPASAEIKAAQWLSLRAADNFVASGYHLKGIFSDWKNPAALKENIYNQAPQMDVVTREALYKPNFVTISPNEITISEYYDALAAVLTSPSGHDDLAFPRYPIENQQVAGTSASSNVPKIGNTENTAATPSSDKMTLNYLQGRAVLGDSTAQFTLAQMYQDGIGVNKDVQAALKLYEQASEQQDLRAEYNLGLLYLEGQGIPADYQKAITTLRDAAFKGNEHAQYVLARIDELGYRNATGEVVIPADPEQAIVMYDLAAANDYGLAQYRLAEMLVREKKSDLSVAAKQNRNQMIKELYQGAFSSGVEQAALPLAFFNAMDKSKAKQAGAFAVATKEANSGNAGAALLLGLMYDRGIGTAVSVSDALHWYQQAPLNPVTAFIQGTYYSQGNGFSKNIEKGRALLQQSADAGFSYANFNLAVMKQQSGETFIPELDKALSLGNSAAGLLLADYYLSLANDDKQMQQARDIYQHFAEKGDKDGQLKLGFMFDRGLGGVVDVVSAEKWYALAAEQNQVVAQYLLGNLYQLGRIGTQPDYALAKKWYSSAQSNYAPAAVALGFIYDTVDDDYKHAMAGYQLATTQHDPVGEYNLGLIYEKGKGRPVDYEKAKALYQEAADLGHTQAMVQLAGIYFNGLAGSRDEEQALALYKKAAALGERDALYQLGLLSETGVATQLDFPEAIRYYQQAADKGNEPAMLALARIYQYGLGVSKNNQQAATYYKKLAVLGNAYAQYQLATFDYEGVDGKRMQQQGKQLLQQAQENGSLQARRVLQWLDAQTQERTSFIEPALISQTPAIAEQPAELMYLDALNEWNRGDERSTRMILDRLVTQFPDYSPARRAHEQLNQQLSPSGIFG
jgi:enhanced entry protein EnhC